MPKPRIKESIQCQHFRWLIYVRDRVYYADGRSNSIPLGRHSLSATTRDEAMKNLAQLDLVKAVEHGLADKSRLENQSQSGPTIVSGWDLYTKSIDDRRAVQSISKKTSKRYRAVRNKFCIFSSEKKITHCHQINKSLLIAYAAWLETKDYAYATRYLEITTLKQLMKYLIDERHLPQSALIKLKMPKPDETDTYSYEENEVIAIVNHCRNVKECEWLNAPIMTMAFTGMRISEVCSLRTSDIDLDSKMIRLTDERHSVARRKQGDVRELKGKRSRSFPIHDKLLPLLRQMPLSTDGLLFHGPLGGRLKPDTVRRCFIRDVLTPLAQQFPTPAGAAKGFIDGRLHSFRHFFCSICANSPKVTEQMIMTWLGHNSSRMIRRYYHQNDDASQQAMQQVAFAVDGTPE